MSIVQTLKSLPDYIGSTGRTKEEITQCEIELGLNFADDYKEYLSEIGLASFNGRELTGISKYARLNVVDITNDDKEYLPNIPANFYVLEELGIDGIVVWQCTDGTIYQSSPTGEIKRIANSLEDYLVRA